MALHYLQLYNGFALSLLSNKYYSTRYEYNKIYVGFYDLHTHKYENYLVCNTFELLPKLNNSNFLELQ